MRFASYSLSVMSRWMRQFLEPPEGRGGIDARGGGRGEHSAPDGRHADLVRARASDTRLAYSTVLCALERRRPGSGSCHLRCS